MINRFEKELALYKSGVKFVVGVDEVGRGPLAGPIVAAAVVFKKPILESWWEEITDSKKLSEKKRERLFKFITSSSRHAFGVCSVKEIEQHNILQASLLAMRRAVEGLQLSASTTLLIDGRNVIPNFDFQQEAIVKGDSVSHSIAAASIIAKVYRDKMMVRLSQKYPEYNLEQHKGYGTRFHIAAIKKHGLSPIHRASFCGNIV